MKILLRFLKPVVSLPVLVSNVIEPSPSESEFLLDDAGRERCQLAVSLRITAISTYLSFPNESSDRVLRFLDGLLLLRN